MNATQETIADKIIKLLKKAESTTPEEAEALFEKAAALQAKHAIDEAMLAHAGKAGEPEKIDEIRHKFSGIYRHAHQDLGIRVGRAIGLHVMVFDGKDGKTPWRGVIWTGYESDLKRADVLLTSLMIQAARAVKPFMSDWKADHSWASGMDRFKAQRSFLFGFSEGAASIITRTERNAKRTAETEHGTEGVSLVLRSKEANVKDWIDQKYGRLRTVRARSLMTSGFAQAAGYTAGRSADMGGRGVGGSRKELGR